MESQKLAKIVGINHVSIEVGDISAAVKFYSDLFDIEVLYEEEMGIPGEELASIEIGDQFIALTRSDRHQRDVDRHIGFVVSDKELVRERISELGIELLPGTTLTFLDPWGNRIEIVSYQNIMFTKSPGILRKMGLESLSKNEKALNNLRKNGFIPSV